MDSLSPLCTHLKRRYDGCFIAWFEGYLQPTLDTAGSRRLLDSSASSSVSTLIPSGSSHSEPSSSGSSAKQNRIRTNWSAAIGPRRLPSASPNSGSDIQPHLGPVTTEKAVNVVTPVIDTRGKTRAQIKAEEYETHCGLLFKEYRACLTNAIGENQSLSTLLEAARDEHSLSSLEELHDTPWDPNTKLESS